MTQAQPESDKWIFGLPPGNYVDQISEVPKAYGQISAVVHPFCVVLASCAARACAVSDRLAASASFPDCWNRCGRGSRVNRFNHHASSPHAAQKLSGMFPLTPIELLIYNIPLKSM